MNSTESKAITAPQPQPPPPPAPTTTTTTTSSSGNNNQYRATRIWHEIIESFQTNIPLKRHWKNFRTYSDCFAANEAIEWLYRYLKSSQNFKSHTSITRQQAIQLLQIFLREKIIEDVRGDKYNSKEFQDDDRLYKFCSSDKYNIQYTLKRAISSTGNTHQSKPSSETPTESITIDTKSLPTSTSQNSVPETSTESQSIATTSSVPSAPKHQTPQPKILKEKNPNELASTYATLPSLKHKSSLNYRDINSYMQQQESAAVFNRRQSLANNLHQKQTAPTSNAWSIIAIKHLKQLLSSSNSATDAEINLVDSLKVSPGFIEHNCTNVNKHGVVVNTNRIEDLPTWLMHAMTALVNWVEYEKEDQQLSSDNARYPSFGDAFNEVKSYFDEHIEPLLTSELSALFLVMLRMFIANNRKIEIDEFMSNLKSHLKQQHDSTISGNGNVSRFMDDDDGYGQYEVSKNAMETSKETDGSQICCSQCLSTYNFVNDWLKCDALEFNEFVFNLNANYRLMNHENEPVDKSQMSNYYYDDEDDDDEEEIMEDENSLSSRMDSISLQRDATEKRLRRNNSFIAAITENSSSASSVCESMSSLNSSKGGIPKTQSMDQISEAKKMLKSGGRASRLAQTRAGKTRSIASSSSFHSLVNHLNNSHACVSGNSSISSLIASNISFRDLKTPISQSAKEKFLLMSQERQNVSLINGGFNDALFELMIKTFRSALILLPPINKRKLHLLLRLMYKLKCSEHAAFFLLPNYEIGDNLAAKMGDRVKAAVEKVIVDAFVRSIVRFDEVKELKLATKLVQLLMNNYSEVMKVPDGLIDDVHEYNSEMLSRATVTYCNRISLEQYEKEKNESKQHIIKSLYSILTDMSVSQDEKLKILKQFKEIHPDIFEEKYATIKKAINILGLNENDTHSGASHSTQSGTSKKRNFSSFHNTASSENFAKNSQQNGSTNDNLNITTAINNFPKFLFPKTLKKIRL